MVARELINMFNEWWNFKINKNASVLSDGGLIFDKETQKDKPSPHSSLTKSGLITKLANKFTQKDGYQISQVANTNSMEPMIDANCVVVLEKLVDQWRVDRLNFQPLVAGDVVIYQYGTIRIIHALQKKVIYQGKPAWIIKGFNNFLPDGLYVFEEHIIARLVCVAYGQQELDGD